MLSEFSIRPRFYLANALALDLTISSSLSGVAYFGIEVLSLLPYGIVDEGGEGLSPSLLIA